MWPSISDAASLVAHYPNWALAGAFLAAIIEALAVFGAIVPGTFILMALAGAAAVAGQPMLPYLAVAILGAVIGDGLSYWAGHHFRDTIRGWAPFARHPQIMARADGFFARHGAFSVALCRFIPVLRSTVPLAAGIAGMSRCRFLVANVASAFVWAPAHVWPAQLAGLSMDRLLAGDTITALWLGGGLIACGVGIWVIHRHVLPRLLAEKPENASGPVV